jgi:hypothetical protein
LFTCDAMNSQASWLLSYWAARLTIISSRVHNPTSPAQPIDPIIPDAKMKWIGTGRATLMPKCKYLL